MKLQARSSGPLGGLVVVDLTRVLAGPYCTMILADLGARVIKVEMPDKGDDARHIGPFVEDGWESVSAYFFSVNRNKESIALDLKCPEDRAVFDRLLEGADILVENFRPGTISRLGYSWEQLHRRHPRLVLASISGFGQTGPYRDLPAYDMVVQAMGGILSLTGEEGGVPTRVGVSIGDLAAGMFAAIGVQAAVVERMRTGVGRHVDVGMLDCQVALLENALARQQVDGRTPAPIGSRHPSITPFGLFKALDDQMVVAAGNDGMFVRLCDALGAAHLCDDPRFVTNAGRCEYHADLKVLIDAALASRPVAYWLERLRVLGIPCGSLNNVEDVMGDPQVRARGMLVELPIGQSRRLSVAANPIQFADAPPARHTPAPRLDQHRSALLQELGMDRSPLTP
ncbi:CoA transferase [Variovorax sp. WS11]|uniref:CaiB/BaiF CoA transferase family protein n=1 Tax=Variovorax sp. WS11 TaxID=1105204 RepID=UPI001EF3696F|nr:CoA transferase [Variovorax sp. WS11]